MSGTFSTAVNFNCHFQSRVTIHMPDILKDEALFSLEIDYDISSVESIQLSFDLHSNLSLALEFGGCNKTYYDFESKNLSDAFHRYSKQYYSFCILSVSMHFTRNLNTEECSKFQAKRNTGFSVSWKHLEPEEVRRKHVFLDNDENRQFIRIANVIHEEKGVSVDMMKLLENIRSEKKRESQCKAGQMTEKIINLISRKYEDVSLKPMHKDQMTEETLSIASELYFEMIFCPNYDPETVQFYEGLFQNFSLETILKTLARILLMSNMPGRTENYVKAKALFDKVSEMFNLHHRDIAAITAPAKLLERYEELRSHQIDNDFIEGKAEYFNMINFSG